MNLNQDFSIHSIRQKLLLSIFIFICLTLLAFSIISYLSIREANEKAGVARLKNSAHEITSMLTNNIQRIRTEAKKHAGHDGLVKYLSTNYSHEREITQYLDNLANDSNTFQVNLHDERFESKATSSGFNSQAIYNPDTLLTEVKQMPNRAAIGKLQATGDTIIYPVAVAVMSDTTVVGYLVRWRKLRSSSRSLEQIGGLIGGEARLYLGNADGSLWTNMVETTEAPYIFLRGKTEYTRPDEEEVVANLQPLQNSPWSLVVEVSKDEINKTTALYFKLIIGIASVLLFLGLLAAWTYSKRISDPLLTLTHAAPLLAKGLVTDLSEIMKRKDELGKLSRAFNAMAFKVDKAKQELQQTAANYKLLFHANPLPMIIYTLPNHRIMDVNEAAIKHYGYSRSEFLTLTTIDIRPEEDKEKYLAHVNVNGSGNINRSIWRHKKKDGSIIMVEVMGNNIQYNDGVARLVLVNDVTEKLNAEAQLIRHRNMEKDLITETTIQAQEEQREEIGKELHDNINQILASTKLYLDLARKGSGHVVEEAIKKSIENVNLAINEIRHLSKQLVAPSFDISLGAALEALCEEIRAITPLTINLQLTNLNEELLTEEYKLNTYRIIQEQVNNILKHAAASHIDLRLESKNAYLYLLVEDDGIGFDTTLQPSGIGLRNIHNRARLHGGEVQLYSQPGKGTRMEILLPLTNTSILRELEVY